MKLVRLQLEEGHKAALLAQEFGVSEYSIYKWMRLLRKHGEPGLAPKTRSASRARMSDEVREKIVG